MASSSFNSNMIQFPRLPSVPETWDTNTDQPLLPPRPHSMRNGRVLKQSKSTESLNQRKDRVEFLRRREWTRRVAAGTDQPITNPIPLQKRARTYSWEDIVAAADAAADSWDYSPTSPGFPSRPDTIDELDEADEPYVIYTATPRPSSSASAHTHAPSAYSYTPHHNNTLGPTVLYSTSPAPSPTLSPLPSRSPVRDLSPPSLSPPALPHHARRGWRGPHSRHSSLSSISEEDEGLARF
ncbi:hypothetical protein BD413DRAFT_612601 [Trametes elegans]|nr:hypothetical protein BD413DRAFT_612601 [Trametes elegans]